MEIGCRELDLNQRHKDFRSSALPTELPRQGLAEVAVTPSALNASRLDCSESMKRTDSQITPCKCGKNR